MLRGRRPARFVPLFEHVDLGGVELLAVAFMLRHHVQTPVHGRDGLVLFDLEHAFELGEKLAAERLLSDGTRLMTVREQLRWLIQLINILHTDLRLRLADGRDPLPVPPRLHLLLDRRLHLRRVVLRHSLVADAAGRHPDALAGAGGIVVVILIQIMIQHWLLWTHQILNHARLLLSQ